MKLSKRAQSLFPHSVVGAAPLALRMVAVYAAQNPGLEFGNYCSGWNDTNGRASYMSESRAISRDLWRVRNAVYEAVAVGVSDDDLLEASRRAYSGRLRIARDASGKLSLDYCTGQYWPAEYRKACASVLETAVSIAQARA